MPNHQQNPSALRVLFLGTKCEFSGIVFSALVQRATRASGSIEPSIEICALLLPAARGRLNAAPPPAPIPVPPPRLLHHDPHELTLFDATQPPDIQQLAHAQSIPIYEVGQLDDPKLAEIVDSFAVDVACVACYPKRVAAALLDVPDYGFLNVHPSLLPHYRGPDPLFWIMRDGAQSTAGGVTVHWMDADFDTGPIAAQQAIQLPDGIRGAEANRLCAAAGGQLLGELLTNLQTGPIVSRPQPEKRDSYQSWPQPSDYTLDLAWSARRAFNFMRGTNMTQQYVLSRTNISQPYTIMLNGEKIMLSDALSYDAEGEIESPFIRQGNEIRIQFTTGVLHALIAEE